MPNIQQYVPQEILLVVTLALLQWVIAVAAAVKSHTFDWNKLPEQLFSVGGKWLIPIGIAYFSGGWPVAVIGATAAAASLIVQIQQSLQALLTGVPVAQIRKPTPANG